MKVSGKQYEVGLETLSDYLEAQMLWQQAYQTRVDAHFQLYVNYIAYLKAAGNCIRPTNCFLQKMIVFFSKYSHRDEKFFSSR